MGRKSPNGLWLLTHGELYGSKKKSKEKNSR
jgi:hypothetical protein